MINFSWKRSVSILVAILAIAFSLRVVNLANFPIFADESIYIRWAQVMKAEPGLRFLPLTDGKQPLYMWTVMPALKLFTDPLFAGRIISVFTGMGTVLGTMVLSYILFKNIRLTLLTGTISSVLPFLVFFDRMALADSLLSASLIWAILCTVLSIKKSRLDMGLIAGFLFGLAWLTKSPAQLMIALMPCTVILIDRKNITKVKLLQSILLYILIAAIAFGMYNLLRLGPQFHMIASRNLDYVFPLNELLKHPMDPLVPHIKDSLNFLWVYLTPIGFVLSIWGLLEPRRSHLNQRIVLGLLFLTPIFINSFIAKAYTARYILFTIPYASILMAHALDHIGNHTKKHLLTYTGLGLLVSVCVYMNVQLISNPHSFPMPRIERSGYLEEWTAGQGIKEIAMYLKEKSTSGENIVVGSEGFFGTPFDGLQLYLNGIQNIRITGVGVWIDSINDNLKAANKENKVYLVVNSSRLHAEPETFKPSVKLIGSYPKATKPDGSKEMLLFFELNKN